MDNAAAPNTRLLPINRRIPQLRNSTDTALALFLLAENYGLGSPGTGVQRSQAQLWLNPNQRVQQPRMAQLVCPSELD